MNIIKRLSIRNAAGKAKEYIRNMPDEAFLDLAALNRHLPEIDQDNFCYSDMFRQRVLWIVESVALCQLRLGKYWLGGAK